ncbi:hypothetical protein [Flavobacterium ginsengiterrae]|uniref:Lipoprotein n=1 Tax=Flavobacterium ginsengiterrae TaxID=871695 RepID=A0ABP7GAR8_9FLAO
MKSNLIFSLLFMLSIISCNNKKTDPVVEKTETKSEVVIEKNENESIEGIYETQLDDTESTECKISLQISKTAKGYSYFLKTNKRKLKGIANFTTEKSGEQFLKLEGIKWDEYEGDISNEEENDSISNSKELEIPVGISANYVKDTLTIQNYGNSMNYYTILSECGRKYIRLIKK